MMATTFQVISLSSLDPDGRDTRDEPKLLYPDAVKTAQELRSQGKAFRVFIDGVHTEQQMRSLRDLGALID
ncbi:hypothetical protein [Pararhizobium sp. PWRC1-1]|uniref:hypothetical protein n=1 Tax=Pararhizobium sp. PWRC1-1 TaxID=2804566 RepID=UPI003CEBF408